jgi:hypothetical protein
VTVNLEPVAENGDMHARLKKRDQEKYVLRRAKELAESGRFTGWLGIEFELRYAEGFELARAWLGYAPVKDELDIICRQARARKFRG